VFQGLTQHSFETHLNTDRANLTSFGKKKNKHTQKTPIKGEGWREEQEIGERA